MGANPEDGRPAMVTLLSILSNWILPWGFVLFVGYWLWSVTRPPRRSW
ncbi:hypothetical protein DYI95_005185 [Thermaerobacter sp. PB12/4term]|nr:hypothetical protein DYI95_005185 [Thermaerobacter sp. PB12/4term]